MAKTKSVAPGQPANATPTVAPAAPVNGSFVLKDVSNQHVHSSPLPHAEAVTQLAHLKAKHEKEAPGRAFQVEIVEC